MRILCLHDDNSSAPSLIKRLHQFAKALHNKHDIELAFVNAPLVVTQKNNTCQSKTQGDPAGNNDIICNTTATCIPTDIHDLDSAIQRTWFYNNSDSIETNKIVGLDASILYLCQIWNQSLLSNPFCGVLGIGQGAALAALLPLLTREQHSLAEDNNNSDDDVVDDHDEDKYDESDDTVKMFQGIQFCVFYNGYDLLTMKNDNSNDKEKGTAQDDNKSRINNEDCCYEEVRDIPSLHIISSPSTSGASSSQPPPSSVSQSKSIDLFNHYGGNQQSSSAQINIVQNDSLGNNNSVYNCIGKFLVDQKKIISSKKRRLKRIQKKLMLRANDGNRVQDVVVENDHEEIEALMEEAKMKLAIVEEKAHSIMASTIASNPPKALMAIITPDASSDGTLVGGWAGHKDAFRSEDFKVSGGAPCPKEFVMKQKDRQK